MKPIRIYNSLDARADLFYSWPFVYLHGELEKLNRENMEKNEWEWSAPDIAVFSELRPGRAGTYTADYYGHPCVIVIAEANGHLAGRVCLDIPDSEDYLHVHTVKDWA